MPINFEEERDVVRIKVVGVGGGGNNVVSRMVASGVEGIEFVNLNTDKPTLMASGADQKIQIGEKLTQGQGAGSDPNIGKLAAEEDRNNIAKLFEDTDAVFITAGMGGGTGTGAAPVVAEIAKESGVLTIAVVTTPFKFEGSAKMRRAEAGIAELLNKVDTLFIIPNEKLKEVSEQKITFANAFAVADGVLNQAVTGIAELLKNTGFINLDFADLKTTLCNSGVAHLGVGEASGKGKIEEVAKEAIYSKLMGTSVDNARRIIINVTGSEDIGMDDVEKLVGKVQNAACPDANIIFGVDFDDTLVDAVRVIVIATDFADSKARRPEPEDKFSKAFPESSPAEEAKEETPAPAPEAEPKLESAASSAEDDDAWQSLLNLFK